MTEPPENRADARFDLANERTLLAWARTALALLVAGGAVRQATHLSARTPLAILLALTGVGAALAGGWRYRRMAAALQHGSTRPAGLAPLLLAGGVAVIGIVLVVAVAAA